MTYIPNMSLSLQGIFYLIKISLFYNNILNGRQL